MINGLMLVFGIAFGFVLSRSRITDYDTMMGMFRLTELHVMGVMGVAMAVSAVGLLILKKSASQAVVGCPIEVRTKPTHKWMAAAGLVFGAGWALTGA